MKKLNLIVSIILVFIGSEIRAQALWPDILRFRNDQLGSQVNRKKEGIMDGNRISTLFYNNSEIAQWPFSPSGLWPKGPSGLNYVDGICLLITAEAVTNKNVKIHPLETYYREEMDDPKTYPGIPTSLTTEPLGLTPVGGYFASSALTPAMSNDESSWPITWPSALFDPLTQVGSDYNGQWFGYFGRNIFSADLETFFVMDDSKDFEFTYPLPLNRGRYYPIIENEPPVGSTTAQELKLYYNPDIRKGLGLRVEARGFQWSNVLAEDIIFWHYDIINLSDHDYSKAYFGFYTDTGLGGSTDNGDDNAGYDKTLDITYGYDKDGIVPGRPELKLGIYGFAYLESPSNFTNGLNDDDDSTKTINRIPMIDERRDDGIDNDGDWQKFIDLNSNGVWDWNASTQSGEPLLDDVGADGAGPFDEPYDPVTKKSKIHTPDFGEGDGLPTAGEPNFDIKDKDESDQIGLTSVNISKLVGKTADDIWPKNDEVLWNEMSTAQFDTAVQNNNIQIVFASGSFQLNGGRNAVTYGRERFSMALLFAIDVPKLVEAKNIVQVIYNANYKFTKPPIKPIVTAIPGDGKVYLSWDERAEDSRDELLGYEKGNPALGPKKDFEGYMIYKSTEPSFDDAKLVTDSKGVPVFWKPIAQWDKVDGIKGPDPIGLNGARFWRGEDTGLQHSFIDKDVINGMTYYYAVVSYDEGVSADSASLKFIPTECTKIIRASTSGLVTFVDLNCAVVTPQKEAAGYESPKFKVTNKAKTGTGSVVVETINRNNIDSTANNKYKLVIKSSGVAPLDTTTGAYVVRNTFKTGKIDTIGEIKSFEVGAGKYSSPFDGMIFSIANDTQSEVVDSLTKWAGNLTDRPTILALKTPSADLSPYKARAGKFDADYEIEFFNDVVGNSYVKPPGTDNTPTSNPTTPGVENVKVIPVKFKIKNINTGQYVKFLTQLSDKTKNEMRFGKGDKVIIEEDIKIYDEQYVLATKTIWPWILLWGAYGSDSLKTQPVTGDKFKIKTRHIFLEGDEIEIEPTVQSINISTAKSSLDKIKVVPNPYIATAIWEQAPEVSSGGRGERKIYFTNLPSECKIKIFTVSGTLVRELNKEKSITDGSLSWDLLNMDGQDVAYGLYVFHVDAPGIGEHIGRFVLIK